MIKRATYRLSTDTLEPFGSGMPAEPAATARGSRQSAAMAIFEIILDTIMMFVLATADVLHEENEEPFTLRRLNLGITMREFV